MDPELHQDCRELAFLLGTWRGEGEGEWPRGEPFRYGEEMLDNSVRGRLARTVNQLTNPQKRQKK